MDTQELKENVGQCQVWLNKRDDVIDKQKLKEIIERHQLWLNGEPGGECAAFIGCDLRDVDFGRSDLTRAIFSYSNLEHAGLYDAQLSEARFYGANLNNCYMKNANLSGANFRDSSLSWAVMPGANLSKAYLNNANLVGANLYGANLSGADLTGATLSKANLIDADLTDTIGVPGIACPEKGSFIGFKQAIDMHTGLPVIVELRILEDAKRSSAFSRKCRCSAAEVVSITDIDGNDLGNISALSTYSCSNNYLAHHTYPVVYSVGDIVSVDSFDDNRWVECSAGIHFFMCRDEAVEYHLSAIKSALRWINSNVNAIDIDAIYSQYYDGERI